MKSQPEFHGFFHVEFSVEATRIFHIPRAPIGGVEWKIIRDVEGSR